MKENEELMKEKTKNLMDMILKTIKYFQQFDTRKTFETTLESYERKSELFEPYSHMESFMVISEEQINKIFVEDTLSSTNKQTVMLSIDRCLGKTEDEGYYSCVTMPGNGNFKKDLLSIF